MLLRSDGTYVPDGRGGETAIHWSSPLLCLRAGGSKKGVESERGRPAGAGRLPLRPGGYCFVNPFDLAMEASAITDPDPHAGPDADAVGLTHAGHDTTTEATRHRHATPQPITDPVSR